MESLNYLISKLFTIKCISYVTNITPNIVSTGIDFAKTSTLSMT